MRSKEVLESFLAVLEILRREAPHIHRNRCMRVERRIHIVLRKDDGSVLVLNLRALHYVGQVSVGVCCTNTTADRIILAKGIANAVTDHAVFAFLAFYRAKKISEHLERLLAIEIICIDDSERFVDKVFTHENSMIGTPRFGTLGVVGTACRHFVNRLEANLTLYFPLILAQNHAAEVILEILTDDKHNLPKSST